MGNVTQVAFQIDNESLAEIDAAAVAATASRAEILRIAVRQYLAVRREADTDARLAAGYAAVPSRPDEDALADVALDGLAASDLDW